ncbi:hypothetical protein PHYBLDRAFT_138912 [Phycomyces blakesleeanus NRRL 1555(-)]|uniref:Uncharacterized protein n=1 Tax=Phycomyces blakesleeanus (strain ATCC 8743b / DSM 1359 / FGSC 10004 / NBRC 33097 / NRRL 1555) TaxID=763407 RepID=A0A162QA77_PHYB8|nr:hypothetical protein PHYBLDRAFT_138912 [Phycomyces blakesleeanus NRRL 1555(-)]OAD81366.1 hypothetical protein PHYBLDRAFT_138912 [Phycomyces blakesleeanus NRRL 1555(-)]|eukprot:XP_018299406.1 hypothetical protein PHYBLDRAFT_138912 [Phycomyces blakesleeanus NRRL 1555(-)]
MAFTSSWLLPNKGTPSKIEVFVACISSEITTQYKDYRPADRPENLPKQKTSSCLASRTVPHISEEQCIHSTPAHVAFWDTRASNIVFKLPGVHVSTLPAPDYPVHVPTPNSLPMSDTPVPVDHADPGALGAVNITALIVTFTTALHSSQLPSPAGAPAPAHANISLSLSVHIERPIFIVWLRMEDTANRTSNWRTFTHLLNDNFYPIHVTQDVRNRNRSLC